jgi:hypothetical protein
MILKCPSCGQAVPAEDVNVAKDVAFCRGCNQGHRLSSMVHGHEFEDGVDLHRPPGGAWFRQDGWGTAFGATHRSVGGALGALAISLFWNGIVSVFVLLALSGTMHNLGIAMPSWFPAPEMNGGDMSTGMTLFLWIFLTPFIVIGTGMIGAFLMCIAGRTEIRIRHSEAVVFTGIGPLGYRRRFQTDEFKEVRVVESRWRNDDSTRSKEEILIETRAGKQIRLGSMLTPERRRFLAAALSQSLGA